MDRSPGGMGDESSLDSDKGGFGGSVAEDELRRRLKSEVRVVEKVMST